MLLAVPTAADAALRASDLAVVKGSPNSFIGGTAALGDVNGDGLGDFAVAFNERNEARPGRIFVVFGGAGAPPSTLNDLGGRGYTVISDDELGVQTAGDFDGDGKADLLVSSRAGSYVVYGKAGAATIDLQADPAQATRVGVSGTNGPRAYAAAGDFNGDGADDLLVNVPKGNQSVLYANAVVFGGPRVATIDGASGPRTLGFTTPQTCRPVYPSWLYFWLQTCERNPRMVTPIGDFDGDGRADLIIESPSQLVFGRAGLGGVYNPAAPTPAGSGIPFSGQAVPVDGAPVLSNGDVNGDGKADLARPLSPTLPTGAWVAVRGRAEATQVNTATEPTIPYAGVPKIDGLPSVDLTSSQPLGDFDGDGTSDRLVPWHTYDADVPTGATTPSPYAGAVILASHRPDRVAPQLTPRTLTNRGPLRIQPDPSNVGATTSISVPVQEPVKLELVVRKVGGLTVGTITRDVRRSADNGPAIVPFDGTVNGTSLAAGDYVIDVTPIDAAGNRGETQDATFTVKTPTTPGPTTPQPTTPDVPKTPIGPLSAFTVQKSAVKQADGSIVLTPAKANVGGQAYWPTAVDVRNSTVEFDLEMTGGTGGGVGMTLAYTPKPPVSPIVPGIGSALGFAGTNQQGFGVAFVTSRSSKLDPGSNFVGIAAGIRPRSSPTSMLYPYSADPGVSLRERTVHVKSTIANGEELTIDVDGRRLIEIPVAMHVKAWLGNAPEIYGGPGYGGSFLQFTASTGPANYQQHLVKNLKVTYD